MFHPSEVELAETTKTILDHVDTLKPRTSGVRFAFGSAAVGGQSATVSAADSRIETILRGSQLYRAVTRRHDEFGSRPAGTEYFSRRNTCWSNSIRNTVRTVGDCELLSFAVGSSGADTTTTRFSVAGCYVLPRLVAAEHRFTRERQRLASGIGELDSLLGGGIRERDEHACLRPSWNGQVELGGAIRNSSGRSWQTRRYVCF